jgi:hypothetical protein
MNSCESPLSCWRISFRLSRRAGSRPGEIRAGNRWHRSRSGGPRVGRDHRVRLWRFPYLLSSEVDVVEPRSTTISAVSKMNYGNLPGDGNFLTLTSNERRELKNQFPSLEAMMPPLYGAQECIRGLSRFCLWIDDKHLEVVSRIPFIADRIEGVRKTRSESKDPKLQQARSEACRGALSRQGFAHLFPGRRRLRKPRSLRISGGRGDQMCDPSARQSYLAERIGNLLKRPIGCPSNGVCRSHASLTYQAGSSTKPVACFMVLI